jgi:hypothetical protein|uniref:RING-type E3 ubiquitin transferase n=1 Tax=Oryza nivara TaxID=4536 RepID=A0A0E0HNN4_ORYNI
MALSLGEVAMLVVDVAFVLCLIVAIMCCCDDDRRRPRSSSQRDAQVGGRVVMLRVVEAPPGQQRVAPAAAKAALPYFPYAQAQGRTSSSETQTLVCAVCLEELKHGELCSEVPACRHIFHRGCVGSWMKKSDSCPLCRVKISSWIAGPTESPTAADAV